ncbi:Translin [Piedraia hortae CBS 480.64]|uniref:Translin n=1 Tax=Piedraia hortae CBS 480.64 TaxID=1314780 RepID=A0A6A7BSW4_9PEZI|nr:Translin [Piedraia hortae CBS 480.64]
MAGNVLFGSEIFESLQKKIDEDTAVKDILHDVAQALEKNDRATQAILSRVHSTPSHQRRMIVEQAESEIGNEIATLQDLSKIASRYPYYKFSHAWTRPVQDACLSILFCGWLGGFGQDKVGKLLTIDEVGAIMKVPVNLKDKDAFHLTIEEYLLALLSLLDELARLARNSVTLGDFNLPQQIAQFIKDVHSGFQILNLKNDVLRKRSDGLKYRVKEVEDVVYDLSLRGLSAKT